MRQQRNDEILFHALRLDIISCITLIYSFMHYSHQTSIVLVVLLESFSKPPYVTSISTLIFSPDKLIHVAVLKNVSRECRLYLLYVIYYTLRLLLSLIRMILFKVLLMEIAGLRDTYYKYSYCDRRCTSIVYMSVCMCVCAYVFV